MPSARFIIDPPAAGAWNMAVDEVLLEDAGRGVATLRLYQWSEPTLSLGYFQAAAERTAHAASRDCPLVRRASGGGAIVHDRELTYCLAMPIAERYGRGASDLFSTVHAALVSTLGRFDVSAHILELPRADSSRAGAASPFLCFQRRSAGDLLIGAAKIAGSAQRRQRSGLVQHGSILLARSDKAAELAGIRELTGMELSPAALGEQFSRELALKLGVVWTATEPSAADRDRAKAIEHARFAADEWTNRR